MRGDSGVAGEGRAVGVPKFHSWGKCTMPITNPKLPRSGLCYIYISIEQSNRTPRCSYRRLVQVYLGSHTISSVLYMSRI